MRTLSLWLTVTSPRAAILGSRDKHVSLGDSLTITCELRQMEEFDVFEEVPEASLHEVPGKLVW